MSTLKAMLALAFVATLGACAAEPEPEYVAEPVMAEPVSQKY